MFFPPQSTHICSFKIRTQQIVGIHLYSEESTSDHKFVHVKHKHMNVLLYPGTVEGFRICRFCSVQCQGNVSLIRANRKQAWCVKGTSILTLCVNTAEFSFEKESHNLSYLLL